MLDDAVLAAEISRIDQLFGAGRHSEAEEICRRLLEAAPDSAVGWFRMGLLLLERKEYLQAEKAFRQAVSYEPGAAVLWSQLAVAMQRQGLAAEAEEIAQRAVTLEPSNADHWKVVGAILQDQRKLNEAVEAYTQSLAIQPRDPATWNDLGVAEQARKRCSEAEQAFKNSLALAPDHPGAAANYAFLLCVRGQKDESIQFLQPIVVQNPFSPEGWMTLGGLYEAMSEWNLAAAAFRRAWELAIDSEQVGYRLAQMLHSDHQLTAAEDVLRQHLSRFPKHASSWALLGEVLLRQCRTAEGLQLAQQAVDMSADPNRHARLLQQLQYDDNVTAKHLLSAHRRWDALYAKPLMPAQGPKPKDRTTELLRIGIVSSDLGHHPTAFLVLPALERLDRSACELIFYSDRLQDDEYATRFRAASSGWRTIFGHSDEQVAALIERDNIDVLIDLMGHTGRRMLLFARKPAPLQITWFGYVGTTGMTAIDCLLADNFHVGEGEDRWYSEQILRMPNGYACYGPPRYAPDVGPLPALHSGHVTFGCFNSTPKLSVLIRTAWAEILRRVPTARLLLKSGGLNDPKLQDNLRGWFADQGVSTDRIEFEGWSPHSELLAAYNRVDIALDTLPYSGGLTTCEALWMGVPVITSHGETFAGRHSTSHLSNAGYRQFIATDLRHYVDLAVAWTERLEDLAQLRASMRDQVTRSPLCDAAVFAGNFLTVLRSA